MSVAQLLPAEFIELPLLRFCVTSLCFHIWLFLYCGAAKVGQGFRVGDESNKILCWLPQKAGRKRAE